MNYPPPTPNQAAPTVLRFPGAGMTYREGWPESMDKLAEIIQSQTGVTIGSDGPGVTAVFRRDPDNPFDRDAIEVHVPALGPWAFVAFVPAKVSSWLAPMLDAGERVTVTVWPRIHPDHPRNPGLTIEIKFYG